MKTELNNGKLSVIDPETGEVVKNFPVVSDEDVFKLAQWIQQVGQITKAIKPIVDNMAQKRIEANGGPLQFGDRRLVFKSYQTFRIPAEAVMSQFEDKDQAVIVLTEAMRADAVTQKGLHNLVEAGTLDKDDYSDIIKNKVPGSARAFAQVEKVE